MEKRNNLQGPVTQQLTSQIINLCKFHSILINHESIDVSILLKNGNSQLEYVETEVDGKMAEMALFLKFKGVGCPHPDLTKHQTNSFEPDLDFNGMRWHSKTTKANNSKIWKFNLRDSLITDPLPNDYLCLSTLKGVNWTLWALVKANKVVQYIKRLNETTAVLNYDDIKHLDLWDF